jgi:hypothetical protein
MATVTERLAFLISANADQAIREFQKTGKAAEKDLGRAEKSLDKIAGNLTKFGAGAMAFAGVAGAGLWKLGEGAAELEASTSALNQVLGKTVALNIADWAKKGATEVGLSERKIVAASTAFGSLGKVAGYAGAELEEFTKRQVRLASDMAAFADVSPEQTIQDLRAAYAGSSETLQKYNVFVNDANIKQAIFAATGEKITGVLTSKQRVMGIDLLLMEQTVDMQGQWARESNSLAGQQATLKANLENLRDGIGKGVLPVMNSLVGGLSKVAGGMSSLNPDMQKGVGTVAAYGTAAIGLAGALSFTAGQAIKMRDRFRSAEGGLNNFGKAAKYAGIALAGLAMAETIGTVMNAISDDAGNVERKLQAMTIATEEFASGTGSAENALKTFRDQVAAVGKGFSLGNLIKDFGKEVTIVGGSIGRDIEFIDEAFQKMLDTSPKAAQALLDAWRSQADALDHSSQQYQDNLMLIDRYQARLDLAAGAQTALTNETDDGADAAQRFATGVDGGTEALQDYEDAVAEAAKAVDDLLGNKMSAIEAEMTYESQVRQTADALNEWAQVNTNVTATEDEKAEALANVKSEAWNQATVALQLQEAWAAANGETLTATQKNAILKQELWKVAQTLEPNSPLRKGLEAWIDDLDSVDTEVHTAITADDSQGQEVLDGWERRLIEEKTNSAAKGKEVGQSAADGIAAGVKERDAYIRRTMTEYVRSMINAAKAGLDIRSPSQVMADEVGRPVSEGIAEGVEDGAGLVADALDDVGDTIIRRAGEIVEQSTDEIARVLDEAESAFDEVKNLIEDRRDHEDAARRVEDAERDLVDAEQDVQRALQESGADSEEYRRAQERLEDAQRDLEDANYRLLQISFDLIDQGPAGVAMFENIARAAGLTRDEIQRLIDKYRELAEARQAAEQAEAIQRPIQDAEDEVTNRPNYQAELDSTIAAYQQKLAEMTRMVQAGQNTNAIQAEMAALAIKASKAYASTQGHSTGTSGYYKAQLDLLRYLVSNQPFLLDEVSSYVKATEASVPGYATGGIVTRPHLAMVGEKGPEAIIPLSKMGTERPMVVNIHVNGADPNQVVDALKRYARQNGAIPVRTMNP